MDALKRDRNVPSCAMTFTSKLGDMSPLQVDAGRLSADKMKVSVVELQHGIAHVWPSLGADFSGINRALGRGRVTMLQGSDIVHTSVDFTPDFSTCDQILVGGEIISIESVTFSQIQVDTVRVGASIRDVIAYDRFTTENLDFDATSDMIRVQLQAFDLDTEFSFCVRRHRH